MSNLGNKEVLAKNLAYYLERSGKDQKEMADIVGVAPSTFSEWMTAKKYPRIDKIELLANYFGILKSDLIEDNSEEEKSPSEPQLTGVDKELWEVLKLMPEDAKKAILETARVFVNNLRKD